jgi:long-chain fatty acid transport protein
VSEKTFMISDVEMRRGGDERLDSGRRTAGRIVPLLASLASEFLLVGSAAAGGLYANSLSTTSQGNAGAGRDAWVPDASATLHNPASMTRLTNHGFASGLSLVAGNVRFDPDSNSPSGTASGGNQVGVAPLASFSYVHRLSDRVRLGLSFFSISGSALDPENDWAGLFELRKLSLWTISSSPTAAIRVTDWLSIGGGPIASYGVLNWNLKAECPPASGTERNVRIDQLNDWEAAGLSPGLDSELPMAQFVEVSAYCQATERLALLGTFNWEDWGVANELSITLASNTVDVTTGFNDTHKIGLGANHRMNDRWLMQTGVMYDTSALRNKDRSPALPVDEQIRFSLGAQHELNDAVTPGMSLTYVGLGAAEVRNPTVRGDYKNNDLFIFDMTLAFKRLPWSGKLGFTGAGT